MYLILFKIFRGNVLQTITSHCVQEKLRQQCQDLGSSLFTLSVADGVICTNIFTFNTVTGQYSAVPKK